VACSWPEQEQVFVRDDVGGQPGGAHAAGLVLGKERRAGDEPVTAQPADQRDVTVDGLEPGFARGGDDQAGQVGQDAVAADRADGDREDAAGGGAGCGCRSG
jgi:hypothetical protein